MPEFLNDLMKYDYDIQIIMFIYPVCMSYGKKQKDAHAGYIWDVCVHERERERERDEERETANNLPHTIITMDRIGSDGACVSRDSRSNVLF